MKDHACQICEPADSRGADALPPLRPVFRFQLKRERRFFGTGANQLLHLVRETGSLLTACKQMDMSYSKGRKVIARVEEELGFRVIESRQGGKTGGFSVLTPQAEALIGKYDAFTRRAEQELGRLFDEIFEQEEPNNQN